MLLGPYRASEQRPKASERRGSHEHIYCGWASCVPQSASATDSPTGNTSERSGGQRTESPAHPEVLAINVGMTGEIGRCVMVRLVCGAGGGSDGEARS